MLALVNNKMFLKVWGYKKDKIVAIIMPDEFLLFF
jgi:hypothetical protein